MKSNNSNLGNKYQVPIILIVIEHKLALHYYTGKYTRRRTYIRESHLYQNFLINHCIHDRNFNIIFVLHLTKKNSYLVVSTCLL